jgi:hypothetical protein
MEYGLPKSGETPEQYLARTTKTRFGVPREITDLVHGIGGLIP